MELSIIPRRLFKMVISFIKYVFLRASPAFGLFAVQIRLESMLGL